MITPLDIENKKFSKQVLNGYNVGEVDDFLDEVTADYEKIYKEATEARTRIQEIEEKLNKYESIESTLQSTLLMAQTTAEDVKNVAKQQAETIISEAETKAKNAISDLEKQIIIKQKELADIQKQFDVYKAKMESLLISQLELLKEVNNES